VLFVDVGHNWSNSVINRCVSVHLTVVVLSYDLRDLIYGNNWLNEFCDQLLCFCAFNRI
jgi:hypothetical protein